MPSAHAGVHCAITRGPVLGCVRERARAALGCVRESGASWRSASGATRCRCDRASVVCLPFSSVQRQVETDQGARHPRE
eukprot:165756-Pleurochrysis_carterae.AAC.1